MYILGSFHFHKLILFYLSIVLSQFVNFAFIPPKQIPTVSTAVEATPSQTEARLVIGFMRRQFRLVFRCFDLQIEARSKVQMKPTW